MPAPKDPEKYKKFIERLSAANKGKHGGDRNPAWRGGKVAVICKICGGIVYRKPSVIKDGADKTCNKKECRSMWMSQYNHHPENIVKKVCVICGKEFQLRKTMLKFRAAVVCSRGCYSKYQSKEKKGKPRPEISGDKSGRWSGGVSFEPYCQKFNSEFKERVRAFFNYECIECGTPQNGMKLHVHHVNYHKMSCCDKERTLFVSLCASCHSKTGKNREYWREHFTTMIDKYYSGNCYLSKEEMNDFKMGCS